MALFLEQLEPGPEVLQMGVDALLAGMQARHGGTWHVVSLPDQLMEATTVTQLLSTNVDTPPANEAQAREENR